MSHVSRRGCSVLFICFAFFFQVILYQGGQMFDGAPRFHGRVGFTGTMPATNVSIFINNTQLSDTGTYQCLVNNLPDRGGRNIGVTGLTVLGEWQDVPGTLALFTVCLSSWEYLFLPILLHFLSARVLFLSPLLSALSGLCFSLFFYTWSSHPFLLLVVLWSFLNDLLWRWRKVV